MADRKVVIILLLLIVYIFFVNPLHSKISMRIFELKHIEKAIAKEKFIEKEAKKIEKIYPQEIKKIQHNKKLFFSNSISVSSAMSYMQKMIKSRATSNSLQVISMNWGAPNNKGQYTALPISFMVKGYPGQIFSFTKDILSLSKLMKFSIYSVSKNRGKLTLRAVVLGFKINTTKNTKETQ